MYKYMQQQPDLNLGTQDYGTITEESFNVFESAGAFTHSFSVFGNAAMEWKMC